MPGIVTPATIGCEHLQQLLQTEEVPRRLRRVRRRVHVGEAEQRRLHQRREDGEERRQREDRRELEHEQVRPDVHLVLRLGARLLDRTGLDDGEQSLRVTAGTGARRCGRGHRGCRRASPPPPPAGAASPPPPPASAALRLRDRSSRCAGMPPLSSVIASPASASPPRPRPRPARPRPPLRPARRRRRPVSRSRRSLSPSTGRPSALRRSRLRFRRCSGTSAM